MGKQTQDAIQTPLLQSSKFEDHGYLVIEIDTTRTHCIEQLHSLISESGWNLIKLT